MLFVLRKSQVFTFYFILQFLVFKAFAVDTNFSNLDLSSVKALVKKWASSEVVIVGVQKHNQGLDKKYSDLDNAKWKKLAANDQLLKELQSNDVSQFLKNDSPEYVTEVFVSGLDGKKVALTKKTTSWDHSGKEKHELPLKNKDWQGKIELDDSTGIHQIQISVPILKNSKVIGSLVVGVSVVKLAASVGHK